MEVRAEFEHPWAPEGKARWLLTSAGGRDGTLQEDTGMLDSYQRQPEMRKLKRLVLSDAACFLSKQTANGRKALKVPSLLNSQEFHVGGARTRSRTHAGESNGG